jgi:hypothetical protein
MPGTASKAVPGTIFEARIEKASKAYSLSHFQCFLGSFSLLSTGSTCQHLCHVRGHTGSTCRHLCHVPRPCRLLAGICARFAAVPDPLAGICARFAAVPDPLAGICARFAAVPDPLAGICARSAAVPDPLAGICARCAVVPDPLAASVPRLRPCGSTCRHLCHVRGRAGSFSSMCISSSQCWISSISRAGKAVYCWLKYQ